MNSLLSLCGRMLVCMYACVHVCMCAGIFIGVSYFVCGVPMCVCVDVCVCVCE